MCAHCTHKLKSDPKLMYKKAENKLRPSLENYSEVRACRWWFYNLTSQRVKDRGDGLRVHRGQSVLFYFYSSVDPSLQHSVNDSEQCRLFQDLIDCQLTAGRGEGELFVPQWEFALPTVFIQIKIRFSKTNIFLMAMNV